jgi:hypothetical protein
MSETITASLTVAGGDTITVNLNTLPRGPAGTGSGAATWGVITGTLSDQTDLQSALDGKSPSSGISPSAITGTAVITTDPRLSDARTPTAHTHVVSDITPVSGQHLIGRHAGGSGAAQEVTVGNGLEFQGSGIRRSALTGDVTASAGSNSTTIANDAVSNTKLANMAQATIKGRASGAGTGDPQDLTASEARTALGSGATGDALFQALTPAAARETLGVLSATATGTTAAAGETNDVVSITIPGAGFWRIEALCTFDNSSSSSTQMSLLFDSSVVVPVSNFRIGGTQVVTTTLSLTVSSSTLVANIGTTVSTATVGLNSSAFGLIQTTGASVVTLRIANTAGSGTSTLTQGALIVQQL